MVCVRCALNALCTTSGGIAGARRVGHTKAACVDFNLSPCGIKLAIIDNSAGARLLISVQGRASLNIYADSA